MKTMPAERLVGLFVSALLTSGCPAIAENSQPAIEEENVEEVVGDTESARIQLPLTITETFQGSSFTIGQRDGRSMTLHGFLAKHGNRHARVDALLITETLSEGSAPVESHVCPDTCGSSTTKSCKYVMEVVSLTWVQTYPNGDAFTGAVARPDKPGPGATLKVQNEWNAYMESTHLCTNGGDFRLRAKGEIIQGVGIFANLPTPDGGDWTVDATTVKYLTTGTFTPTFGN